jgi:hypothetical protein
MVEEARSIIGFKLKYKTFIKILEENISKDGILRDLSVGYSVIEEIPKKVIVWKQTKKREYFFGIKTERVIVENNAFLGNCDVFVQGTFGSFVPPGPFVTPIKSLFSKNVCCKKGGGFIVIPGATVIPSEPKK